MNNRQNHKKKFTYDKEVDQIPAIPIVELGQQTKDRQISQLLSIYSKVKFTLYYITGFKMTHYILQDRKELDDFIMVVESGRIKVKVNKQVRIIEKPTIVFAQKDDLFSWESLDDKPAVVYGIHGMLSDIDGLSILNNLECTFFELEKQNTLISSFKEIYLYYNLNVDLARNASLDWIRKLLCSITLRGIRIDFDSWTVTDEVVRKAIYLIQNQQQISLNVNDLAAKLNISRIQLNRKFQKHLNKNIRDYLVHYRLAEARKLLLGTSFSIQEISNQLGFCSGNYFFTVFKAYYGLSPKKYREVIEPH